MPPAVLLDERDEAPQAGQARRQQGLVQLCHVQRHLQDQVVAVDAQEQVPPGQGDGAAGQGRTGSGGRGPAAANFPTGGHFDAGSHNGAQAGRSSHGDRAGPEEQRRHERYSMKAGQAGRGSCDGG